MPYRFPKSFDEDYLRGLMKDARYANAYHPEHRAWHEHIAEGYKRLYPGLLKFDATGKMIRSAPATDATETAGGPGPVHVRAYEQTRHGHIVPVSAHERGGTGSDKREPTKKPSTPPMKSPVPDGQIRRKDGYGEGHFGARRTKSDGSDYHHQGVDIIVAPGKDIKSPVSGTVEGAPFDPYGKSGDKRKIGVYQGITIRTEDGHRVRVMYIDPAVEAGDKVEAGATKIGTAQDLAKVYPPKPNGEQMTNHIHVDVMKDGVFKDPTEAMGAKKVR
ncbi:MAG: hypothetical protein HZC25_10415 [Rhodospirillales bacterium]|nr:hypothetical protein [Rhodospirillales bacterium]